MTGIGFIMRFAVFGLAGSAFALASGVGTGLVLAESSQEEFLLGATDIPLMPGLSEDEATTVFFDKPAGRIMIARPGGCIDPAEARLFYGTTLPQLGWLPAEGVSGLIYLREDERLTLEFAVGSADDCMALDFILSPVSGRVAGDQ